MNPDLAKLQPYPFERLRLLYKDITPDPRYAPVNLGIGEPKHPTPEFIRQALARNLSGLGRRNTGGGKPPADGKYSLYCAVIVKRLDAGTRAKTCITRCCMETSLATRAAPSRGLFKGERQCQR